MNLIQIDPSELLPFDVYTEKYPLRVDLVYAQPAHKDNIFKTGIYRPDAKMWGHRDLVPIVLRAAEICYAESKYIFELKDCLRTTDAQQKMLETDVVKANPSWLEEPGRLLSPPGKGGHPRGMAVDIILIHENGSAVDMGTAFDYFAKDYRICNPSGRDYKDFSAEILRNRQILEDSMMQAAKEAGRALLPLPQEWWDFRFPYAYTNQFSPVSDGDLSPSMRMT